jgi:antitoxin (DNA-binding transcriptional repressor) of toxin-antitoxin stability system
MSGMVYVAQVGAGNLQKNFSALIESMAAGEQSQLAIRR